MSVLAGVEMNGDEQQRGRGVMGMAGLAFACPQGRY